MLEILSDTKWPEKTLTKAAKIQLLRSHFRGQDTCNSSLSCFAFFQPDFSVFQQQTQTHLFQGSLSSQSFVPGSKASPCFSTALMWGTLLLSFYSFSISEKNEQCNRRVFFLAIIFVNLVGLFRLISVLKWSSLSNCAPFSADLQRFDYSLPTLLVLCGKRVKMKARAKQSSTAQFSYFLLHSFLPFWVWKVLCLENELSGISTTTHCVFSLLGKTG